MPRSLLVALALGLGLVFGAATPALAIPILSGTQTVEEPGFGAFTAEIHFAVFEESAPDNPMPSPGDLTFVYTLSALDTSDVGLIGFGVQVPPGTSQVTAGFIDGSGVEPDAPATLLAQEVRWEFSTLIEAGQTSELLFLTAPFAPGEVDISVNGDFALDAPTTAVGPVPEPSLSLLLALGSGLGAAALRRKGLRA